ncbi:antibiotic biosynthesis monooxygenase [Streptomyces sp. NPDC050355]|uniref:antibiotic biosynthesis monooxygenase n=1 Tax=Streptomyces sp. NPDC050355 TaxID=3365609 RepID=UPI0037A1B7D5
MTHFLDLVHPHAGTALMSEWLTGTAERSRAAADAAIDEWAAAEPPAALLAQHVFLSTDGAGLLYYAQWTSDEAHLAWARARRPAMVGRVDALVPGVERPGLHRTRLHRSVVHDAGREPGVLVVATTAADQAAGAVRAAPGLLAGHIHLTADGERAIVVTEWTDAAAHEAAAADGPAFKRYTLLHAFRDDRAEDAAGGPERF